MADKLEITKEDIRQVVAVYMENLLTKNERNGELFQSMSLS